MGRPITAFLIFHQYIWLKRNTFTLITDQLLLHFNMALFVSHNRSVELFDLLLCATSFFPVLLPFILTASMPAYLLLLLPYYLSVNIDIVIWTVLHWYTSTYYIGDNNFLCAWEKETTIVELLFVLYINEGGTVTVPVIEHYKHQMVWIFWCYNCNDKLS